MQGPLSCIFPASFQHPDLAGHAIFHYRHVFEQVERLKDHADPGPVAVDLVDPGEYVLILVDDPAGIGSFKQIDAAQKSGFARARSPDDADDVLLLDIETDVSQDMVVAERFGELSNT